MKKESYATRKRVLSSKKINSNGQKNCDILSNFLDQEGTKVISNVFKFGVMIKQNIPSQNKKIFNEK